jgi:hypothetical protein
MSPAQWAFWLAIAIALGAWCAHTDSTRTNSTETP